MNIRSASKPARQNDRQSHRRVFSIFIIGIFTIIGGYVLYRHMSLAVPVQPVVKVTKAQTPVSKSPAKVENQCSDNSDAYAIIVSLSEQHLWACAGAKKEYDSAVVTGMQNYAADVTPVGVYAIYAKQTALYLTGSDSTGSWHDWVNYWMPFLSNRYGIYGFHDATWRSDADFGHISPASNNASHGCIELPLGTAKWLYDWAPIGTTVIVQ